MDKITNNLGVIKFRTISLKTLGVVFVILALFAGLGVHNAVADIPSAERNALFGLYINTGADNLTDNTELVGRL